MMKLKSKLVKFQFIINWEFLSKLGKNKVVTTSYIWVIIVPILAKIIFFMQPMYSITFRFPFSWELFYYASIAFMIGTLLFVFFCPKIILENKTYADFNSKGLGVQRLLEYSDNEPKIQADIEIDQKEKKIIDEKLFFASLWEKSLYDKQYARYTITFFYFIGLGLFLIVFLQNIFTVITYSYTLHLS